jgi:hypothetical protein
VSGAIAQRGSSRPPTGGGVRWPTPAGPKELSRLVAGYLAHCRTLEERFTEAALTVTAMSFKSPPEAQWEMVLEGIRQSRDDDDLEHVAAGPIEGLLGRHGEVCIALVEARAASDSKFARAMTGVRRYTMTDAIWARVRRLQSRVPNPLASLRK